MAQTFKFELVSPEKLLVSGDVESVVMPGSEGEITIMAHHAPVMTSIRPGVISVQTAGKNDRYVIFGGFADITPNTCTILAEEVDLVADLDHDLLAQRIQDSLEDVADAKDDETRQRAQERLDHLTVLQSALAA